MSSAEFFDISGLVFIIATVIYLIYFAFRKKTFGIAATTVTIFGFIIMSIGLIVRWVDSYNMWVGESPASSFIISLLRSVPVKNLYESVIFFVWTVILIYLIMEFIYKKRSLGTFVIPVAALAMLFIDVYGTSRAIELPNPALQSNWMPFHVLLSFAGYAAFSVSFGAGLMSLILSTERRKESFTFWLVLTGVFALILMTSLLPKQLAISTIFISAVVFLILDLILNYGIFKYFLQNKEFYSPGRKSWYALFIAGLILFDASQVYLLILTPDYIVIPAVLCMAVLIKYLLLEKETHLFWTATVGIFLVILVATGLDFAIFKAGSRPEEFIQNYFLKASFRNSSMVIVTVSWTLSIAFVFAIWRLGNGFKKTLEGFSLTTDMLDEITYKTIAIGFPLFTVGALLMGLIWAKGAWGRYWGWDPKETWSLITWLVYAIYLHARMISGWKGQRLAVLAVIGFVAAIVTYLGVNLIIKIGLHAYS